MNKRKHPYHQIWRHEVTDEVHQALSKLQDYYGKRLSSSNERMTYMVQGSIKIIDEIKERGYYDTQEQIILNEMRREYYKDLKEYGKGFKDMNNPFGPKVTII